jgi:hypothetical protein
MVSSPLQMGRKVIADPVGGTADAIQRNRPSVSVGNHCQPREVKTYVRAGMLEPEPAGVRSHVASDREQARHELLAVFVIVEFCLERRYRGSQTVTL